MTYIDLHGSNNSLQQEREEIIYASRPNRISGAYKAMNFLDVCTQVGWHVRMIAYIEEVRQR